jgi:hypothetical protein
MKIIEIILIYCQPFAIIIFAIAGICAMILGKTHQGAINLAFAIVNFIIFYGGKFLK